MAPLSNCSCSYPFWNTTSSFAYIGTGLTSSHAQNVTSMSILNSTSAAYQPSSTTPRPTVTTTKTFTLDVIVTVLPVSSATIETTEQVTGSSDSRVPDSTSPGQTTFVMSTTASETASLPSTSMSGTGTPLPIPPTQTSKSRSSKILPVVITVVVVLVVILVVLSCLTLLLRGGGSKLGEVQAAILKVLNKGEENRNNSPSAASRVPSQVQPNENGQTLQEIIGSGRPSDEWSILEKQRLVGLTQLKQRLGRTGTASSPEKLDNGTTSQQQSKQIVLDEPSQNQTSFDKHAFNPLPSQPIAAEWFIPTRNHDTVLKHARESILAFAGEDAGPSSLQDLRQEVLAREEKLRQNAMDRFRLQALMKPENLNTNIVDATRIGKNAMERFHLPDMMKPENLSSSVAEAAKLGKKLQVVWRHSYDGVGIVRTIESSLERDNSLDRCQNQVAESIESNQSCEVRRSMESDCLKEYFEQLGDEHGEVVLDTYRKLWEGK